MVSISRVLLQWPIHAPHTLPIHDGYGTEPPTWYDHWESHARDTQWLHFSDGSGHERSTLGPISGSGWHGPLLRFPLERGPLVYGWRQGLDHAEYHYDRPMKKLDQQWLAHTCGQSHSWIHTDRNYPRQFGRTHPMFSVTLLRPYNADMINWASSAWPSSPCCLRWCQEYEVELHTRQPNLRGKTWVLVRWRIWHRGRQWDHLQTSKVWELVSKFHRRTPRHPNTFCHQLSQTPFHHHQLMDTSDIFSYGWATGQCTSGHHSLRGGECQGHPHRSYSKPKSYWPSRAYVIQPICGPIPIPDSIISLDSTQGRQPEQLYSSSAAVGPSAWSLRITTASVHLCVSDPISFYLWYCSSGIVIVSPSQLGSITRPQSTWVVNLTPVLSPSRWSSMVVISCLYPDNWCSLPITYWSSQMKWSLGS